jgi:hypothetical protein
MVRADSLLRERLILPHFNSLWIVRESAKVLAETNQWLDDSSLVKLLNEREVIRGTDPRRARNIFEAALYLGLVKRRAIESRKFEYTVTSDGRALEKCAGTDFPCSEIERDIFVKSLRFFKIPNAAQYQEPSRFKTIYQHKRVRPFLVLLKAFEYALQNGYKPDLVTASAAVYANDEKFGNIASLVKHVHSKFERPNTSKAPFRDAHTLVSWGRQVGLLRGEGLYELTDDGRKFLQIASEERPVWWIDSTIQEFIALSVMKEVQERGVASVSFSQLAVEVEKIVKDLAIFRSKSELILSELDSISVVNDKAKLKVPVSINIASDVPFEHQEKILSLISDSATRLSKLPAEIEILRKRVKELEIEIARQKEQLSKGISVDMPQVDELPLLATFDQEVIHKYGGQTLVATEFEKRVCYVFQLLNYDVVELGHKTKEIAPDAILVNKYPSLLKTGPNEAVFIECKASKQPYKFSRHDVREIQDYVERWYGRCLKEYMAVPTTLVIVGGQFVSEVVKRSSELEKKLYNMGLIFINAEMLVSLMKQFIKDPGSFKQETKACFFNKLVKEAHRQNAPLASSKETLKN